jgi:3'-5' exoribonuclease
MKKQFVKSLQEGDTVNDYFIATRNDLRSKQDGGKFLGMVFKDKTGEVGGIMWSNASEVSKNFRVGDVVNVRGKVNSYQNRLQVQVEQVLPMKEGEYDLGELVFTSGESEEDLNQLRAILDTVKDEHLQALLQLFWNDADFMSRFTVAAAAKKWHHEYRGGLVRHYYEMARIAETMCSLYPEVDRDLLLTCVFLHDLGKLYELTHEMFVDYTTEGKLIGHIHIGAEMAKRKMAQVEGLSEKTRLHVTHCILAHHGELEYGSPVVPKTLEATILYHIDNLDAQAAAISRIVRETQDKHQEWSEYIPLIERVIWAKGGKKN